MIDRCSSIVPVPDLSISCRIAEVTVALLSGERFVISEPKVVSF